MVNSWMTYISKFRVNGTCVPLNTFGARPSHKGKQWNQYDLGVAFHRTMYGLFVLNKYFWDMPSFLLHFTCFFTTPSYPVPNYLLGLPLLHSYLCLSLLSDTRMLNASIYLKISGDVVSKWFKDCCNPEVPLPPPTLTLLVISQLGMDNLCQ